MSLKKYISNTGYKADSPDRNNPYNVIPSNQITMENVPHPVYGIDNLGNQQMMMPGGEYEFGGDYVTEFPIMQGGGSMRADSLINYNREKEAWDKIKHIGTASIVEYDDLVNQPDYDKFPYTGELAEYHAKDVGRLGYYDTMIEDGPGNWIPVSLPIHKKPGPLKRKTKDIKKVQPLGLPTGANNPNIDTTIREGAQLPPQETIVGYTQRWDPDAKKYIQEPQWKQIPEADPNRYKQLGGAYEEMELSDQEIASMRAQGYIIEEM